MSTDADGDDHDEQPDQHPTPSHGRPVSRAGAAEHSAASPPHSDPAAALAIDAATADDLAFALELADVADVTTPGRCAPDLVVETKPDLTPVTEADRR